MSERIVIISGATACGKSQLALDFGGEKDIAIINADSLQIFEGLPILSSQPSKIDQEKVSHYLYSHLKPQEKASVGVWLGLVKDVVEKVLAKNKLPVIVGGTGMYIAKLIDGISKMPEVSDLNHQKALELYEEMGHEKFQENFGEGKLIDKQRLLRACEIKLESGQPISFWQEKPREKIFPDAHFVHLNLEINREKLYQNCDLRFEKMLKNGALEEVKNFLKSHPENDWQITKTLGFEEISLFLENKISHEDAQKIAAQKTRNYAKRQLTFFRNQFTAQSAGQFPEKIIFNDAKQALEFLKKL